MYKHMNLTCKNDALDSEIPSTSDEAMSQVETDGLLVYSEKDVKGRVRKSIFVTLFVCMFLALVGMSAALIHARDRKPDESMQIIAKEFQANNGSQAPTEPEEGKHVNTKGLQTYLKATGKEGSGTDNNHNRELYYSSYCYETTWLYAAYDVYDAAYWCLDALYVVGCNGGASYILDYYQYYYGGLWYVQCYCDC
jgi:hypothetical protein